MTEEIKEILDIERYRNKDGYVENISLLPSEIHKILDYITNLQKEIEREKQFTKDCGFANQQQLALAYLDYKQRNEKAIEYIKSYKNDYAPYELSDYNIRELLNILNGGDDNE